MIPLPEFESERVAVMGLGKSGMAAAVALRSSGARVLAWDDDAARRDAAVAEGLEVSDLRQCDFAAVRSLVWSPGIPHGFPRPHPVATAAERAGCEIVCDVDLLWRARREARFVGITGTNGKSTTTALLGHILSEAGIDTEIGGNLGPPALGLRPLGRDGVYVLEMSSYQLELVPNVRFDVAVLLNVTPDHLDRHGGMHRYVAAKRRAFDRQRPSDVAIIAVDDDYTRSIRDSLEAGADRKVIAVSVGSADAAVVARDEWLTDEGCRILDLSGVPTLPGRHNRQNAAAAYAAARALGVPEERAAAAIPTYPGLPHRQERVATIGGAVYVNDSKATNAESAACALSSYTRIYWIAGGLAKEGGIEPLVPLFDRIVHAFLIGRAAPEFARTLEGRVPYTLCGDLADAVEAAHAMVAHDRPDDGVVLLSPACASFDQWPSFEARGDAFRTQVRALAAQDGGRVLQ